MVLSVVKCLQLRSPIVVEYELTEYSETLDEVLHSLSTWGTMHKQKIRRSMKKEKSAPAN